jgi:transcriptional regulator with XRE-family HTH domain
MTTSFGARLRQERERRRISLASIAENTKIKASLFAELERDDVSRWPAGIFRRSYVRAYADAIGLDADSVVREFLERFPDPAPAPAPGKIRASDAPPTPTSSLRMTLADGGSAFSGGRYLPELRRRWTAVAWDGGALLASGICFYLVLDRFWMAFAIFTLCYYVGGILTLGNTPGVCLFAPKVDSGRDGAGRRDPGSDSMAADEGARLRGIGRPRFTRT